MYAGAAVRVITTNGRTPMFVAAEKGLGEMIRVMVEDCHVSTRNYFLIYEYVYVNFHVNFHLYAYHCTHIFAEI